ncbi:MAG: hypothetical protein A3H31_04495 [Gallionellales bacterium RIFCSPLOWO2_02_FULL_57_47]|nr:MAG: hypothetical protein A3H31_04495 [Gallionellales bacterium RIFCSPLOWO2_02_FULL_57_47]OGT16484.1 MAG: hypothetical protein A3J49_17590 [Gallionellales bacterium RIFCSPHIGHO2_02_FULL_57_16]
MHEESPLVIARWGAPVADREEICFVADDAALPDDLQGCNVVLGNGSEARAEQLLARGAARVLLADAAMLDSTAVSRLVQGYGAERIGVALLATKRHVSWSLDIVSNADFRCLTPSVGKHGWEIVLSDGTASGTDAVCWVGEMLALGVSMALIRVDMQDEDLNTCAGLVEAHGNKLWFSPWQRPDADLEPWVRYGQLRRLLLPAANARDETEMARIRAAAMPAQEELVAETAVEAAEGVGATV